MSMPTRSLGPFTVAAIGLGCMNLSHAYGVPPSPEAAEKLLLAALDLGVTLFDTAALYGFGQNESLLGRVLKDHRRRIVLASKCGMTGVDGKRVIDGRPETLRRTCDESLARLQTDVIDLYYLHRWDKQVPIEESVGALGDLVRQGKIRTIGLSEVSAGSLHKAHAEHPIAAVQNEYSLWTREPEIGLLAACKQLGVAFVAFSPLGRGFLTSKLREPVFVPKDIRQAMPRFQPENFQKNLALLAGLEGLALEAGCTPAQLSMVWLLAKAPHIIAIPGTTQIAHLEENLGAVDVAPSRDTLRQLDLLINEKTVAGPRYPALQQQEVDTETFQRHESGE